MPEFTQPEYEIQLWGTRLASLRRTSTRHHVTILHVTNLDVTNLVVTKLHGTWFTATQEASHKRSDKTEHLHVRLGCYVKPKTVMPVWDTTGTVFASVALL